MNNRLFSLPVQVLTAVLLLFSIHGLVTAQDTAAAQETAQQETAQQETEQDDAAQEETAQDPASNADAGGDSEEDRQALVEKLERYLSGVKFIGQFTVAGNEDAALTAEEYTIKKAEKTPDGDYWLLTVRIKYGDHDIEMVLPPLEIKWADGTPVITVDQMTIPGLGTFDARVLIRKNMYAGTWSHNDVGGHLFGNIERIEDGAEVNPAAQTDNEPGETMTEEPKAITIQHILIGFEGSVPGKNITRSQDEAKALVKEIMDEINDGADFDQLVQKYTDDSHPGIYHMVNTGEKGDRSSADQSEWVFERGGMVPAFGNAGFILDVGEVGVAEYDPAASEYGWHVVKRLK